MANDRQTNYFVHTLLRARDWQHRPEFDDVCGWWSDGGLGVCALVGMGGAGKTAIADRFLNELQTNGSRSRKTSDGHSNGPNSHESGYDDLPPPNSVFVYSFYDDDKPENFFRELQIWLEGAQTLATRIAEIWEKPLSPMELLDPSHPDQRIARCRCPVDRSSQAASPRSTRPLARPPRSRTDGRQQLQTRRQRVQLPRCRNLATSTRP